MTSKYELFYTFDDPVPYKNLRIYPALLRQYAEFYTYVDCLLLEIDAFQGTIEEKIKVISMKYVDFLFYSSNDKNQSITKLVYLLRLVLRNQDVNIGWGYDSDQHIVLRIDDGEYNWEDFENIRNIICEQNLVELPDLNIQKEIRDSLKKAKEFKNKSAQMADLEDQIIAVAVATGISIEDIYSLSLRKFRKLVERADALINYKILMGAKMSGFVEFKDKTIPKHWLADLDEKKDIPDGLVPIGDIQKKIGGQSGE